MDMTGSPRRVERIIEPQQVIEGAGVRLRRSIGTRTLNYHDPFLLLDHFAATDPNDYQAGFPMHPHRGIETVTYVLEGSIDHRDTVGNSGSISAGDLQWMSAGGGIMHEEMPQVRPEGIAGFQLWVNLPAKLKMSQPRYQGIEAAEIPEVQVEGGSRVRIIAGEIKDLRGPIRDIAAEPAYLDVFIPPQSSFTHPIARGQNCFAYVFEGGGLFGGDNGAASQTVSSTRLVVFEDGDYVSVATRDDAVRFLLVSARPLDEPIARYGPFVMNTKEEIEQALKDLRQGTFIWSDR
jgi:redox-sensitive bicupin YhaK (pirin superfamily)